ncbi:MAG: hypothetical protein HZA61_10500 [Candidatus Eisenbacteria bacterium]|uniref:Uncharacterized protein n=1 Tax=Eiseniibacteriota bacterium TaxID=2212470 RepID=A0A933SDT5_UNCEI|nr:hypothetical protein [Candidatus Eisenbacteria bacterium]
MTESTPKPAPETLAPTPAGCGWGRRVAIVYLALVGLALVLPFVEVARGEHGLGAVAVTVLTAPWSGLLANLAQAIGPSLPVAAMRALGVTLTVAAALLNARVFYGIVARMERDARSR